MSKYKYKQTRTIRSASKRSEQQEHNEALYLTSSFVFDSAEQAYARFKNEKDGNIYGRFTNPNSDTFTSRLAALEDMRYGVATASGMGAILTVILAHLKAGDHVLCAACIFGTTTTLFRDLCAKFSINTTFVVLHDTHAWKDAIQPNTRMLFCESPANPTAELTDLAALAEIAHSNHALFVVDNCLATPIIQQPVQFGADVVIHSGTKFIDGQGRCLGGALLCNDEELHAQQQAVIRTAGISISPFNAWILSKSLETLQLRVHAHNHNALLLAQWLQTQDSIKRVFYSGLESHPQRQLSLSQQGGHGGGVVAFEVIGGRDAAWALINQCSMISITANFGDTKSTITHPATTTHWRMSQAERDAAQINDGLVRIGVGLEHIDDIKNDLNL